MKHAATYSRRRFLAYGASMLAFGATAAILEWRKHRGYIVPAFARRTGNPRFALRKKIHLAAPGLSADAFYKTAEEKSGNSTAHFVFPPQSYQGTPKLKQAFFRSRPFRGELRPASKDETLAFAASAPPAVANQALERLALAQHRTAAGGGAAGPSAVSLLLAAAQIEAKNFTEVRKRVLDLRLFDLTAGLAARAGDENALAELTGILRELLPKLREPRTASHVQSRLQKWNEKDSSWLVFDSLETRIAGGEGLTKARTSVGTTFGLLAKEGAQCVSRSAGGTATCAPRSAWEAWPSSSLRST